MGEYMYCTVADFREYIKNLPENVSLIRCTKDRARFFVQDEDLVLDQVAEIWVHTRRRKIFRKVKYAHFGIDIPPSHHEHYVLYYICEPEK